MTIPNSVTSNNKSAAVEITVGCTEHTLVIDPAVAPTRTESGLTEGSHCAVCGSVLSLQEEVAALGHAWSEAAYTWNEDLTAVTAARVCARDAEHMETETVGTTATIESPAEDAEGAVVIVSDPFANDGFEAQSVRLTIPALGTLNVLRLPQALLSIEDSAFAGLTVQAGMIPDGCISIGSRAFANCPNLLYVRIPSSATSLAVDSFDGCPQVVIDRIEK